MLFNVKWTRWIIASINQYFKSNILSLPLFVEGTDRRTESLADYAELRIDGPFYTEESRGYWCIDVVIDVLIVNKFNDQNIYTFENNIGNVLNAFDREFPVYEYGDFPNLQLGCFQQMPGEAVIVTRFGQVKNDARLRQASVEGKYRMYLSL